MPVLNDRRLGLILLHESLTLNPPGVPSYMTEYKRGAYSAASNQWCSPHKLPIKIMIKISWKEHPVTDH
jgi:hypothetical protein